MRTGATATNDVANAISAKVMREAGSDRYPARRAP
jgi:hypothetical protein